MEDQEMEPWLEPLLELLRQLPKQRVTVLNLPRYQEAMQSANQIVAMVREDCPSAKVRIDFDELVGTTLCLTIIAEELNIYRMASFYEAAAPANNMCVSARIDGKVEIGFTYQKVQIPVPPADLPQKKGENKMPKEIFYYLCPDMDGDGDHDLKDYLLFEDMEELEEERIDWWDDVDFDED